MKLISNHVINSTIVFKTTKQINQFKINWIISMAIRFNRANCSVWYKGITTIVWMEGIVIFVSRCVALTIIVRSNRCRRMCRISAEQTDGLSVGWQFPLLAGVHLFLVLNKGYKTTTKNMYSRYYIGACVKCMGIDYSKPYIYTPFRSLIIWQTTTDAKWVDCSLLVVCWPQA